MTQSTEELDLDAKAARRRREKPQLSCNLCRKRKLRCDRSQPCNNCSRRGLEDSCTFPESNVPRPAASNSPGQSSAPNVKGRVKQLESQVDFLMGALSQANPSAAILQDPTQRSGAFRISSDDQEMSVSPEAAEVEPESAGYVEFFQHRTSYVGSAHWWAIMRSIPELADVVGNASNHLEEHVDEDEADLSEWPEKVGRREILNAVPSKEFVDSLVAVCFTNTNNEAMIVHPPTFRKEYEKFWADPTSAPVMWIGLLFSLMCLAVQYQRFSPDEAQRLQVMELDPEKLIRLYHEKTIQCLILAKYGKGPPYAVETVMLYLFIEALRGQNIKSLDGPWIQWGTLIRIAYKAGYHLDGSHFREMSCFQAEMRRRVWTMMVGWDLYLSVQFALPRMINPSLCDTMEPRNLYDDDLYDHMVELPPPRPETAQSFSQFHVARNRLLEIFGEINNLTMSTTIRQTYSEVLRLDNLLTDTYNSIISMWQPRPTGPQPGTVAKHNAGVSVNCTFIASIYHRAQIVLHRKYMSAGRKHKQYAYSRKVAIEAGLTTLQHQWVLYLETQVGGQLCRHGWKFLVLLVQDFLLATAILCAELAEDIRAAQSTLVTNNPTASIDTCTSGNEMRDRVFHALSSAYIVWLQSSDSASSRKVKAVVASLKHLLYRAQEAGFGQSRMIAPTPPSPLQNATSAPESGGMETTPSDHLQSGSASAAATPQVDGLYWGIANFPT